MSVTIEEMRAERNRVLGRERRRRNTLRQLRGESIGLVDAEPIRAHLHALFALDWGAPAIIAATGHTATPTGIHLLANGDSIKAERKHLAALLLPHTYRVPERVGDALWVPATGTRRRLRSLLAFGWRHEDLEPWMGRSTTALTRSVDPPAQVRASTWRAADRAFRALGTTPGPSKRGRMRALGLGYGPPAAWDDIDNPRERPKGVVAA